MSVVNVQKRELRRSGYRSLKDWIDNPDNVYIGRKTSGAPDNYDFKWHIKKLPANTEFSGSEWIDKEVGYLHIDDAAFILEKKTSH